jgi:hypothetical protein
MYRWLVFFHVVGAFGFLLSHGVPAMVSLRLGGETDRRRIGALFELSNSGPSMAATWGSFLVMLVTGIAAGFIGRWWRAGWIWVAIGVLVVVSVAMTMLGSRYMNDLRQAVGLPWFDGRRQQPGGNPLGDEELARRLSSSRPRSVAVIGFAGIGLLIWLMMFKPF